MAKITDELANKIGKTSDLSALLQDSKEQFVDLEFQKLLQEAIEHSGLERAEVIRRADIERSYGYLLFQGKRVPARDALLRLCIGMGLDVERA